MAPVYRFWRIVLLDSAISLIPTVFGASIGETGAHLWRTFVMSLVYSNVIGGLCNLVIPVLWPLQCNLHTPWRWAARWGILLVIGVIGTSIACGIFLLIGYKSWSTLWPGYWMDLRIAVLLTLMVGTAVTLFENMRAQLEQTTLELRTKELERERALKLATEARLSSLESRLHPHFLFNTLNSISALIQEDPVRAERLVERMAALLRFSLDSKQNGLVPLERELKIVTDYLEIEKARFGDRLRFDIDVPKQLGQIAVPPLALQTLVENSVKFAVAPNRAGGDIHIFAEPRDGFVELSVEDSGPGFLLEEVPAGHGIDNLRSRLFTLFGEQATLHSVRGDAGSSVNIGIPRNGHRYEGFPGR